MKLRTRCAPVLSLFAAVALAPSLHAAPPRSGEYFLTGEAVRTKSIAFLDFDVYRVQSWVKELPSTASKQALIDLAADKKIELTMLRDLSVSKIVSALEKALDNCAYTDQVKIAAMMKLFTKDLEEGDKILIAYDASNRTTSLVLPGRPRSTLEGEDFMKGVWCIWAGVGIDDQPEISDQLIANLR